jgi:AraC family transcriptional regulator
MNDERSNRIASSARRPVYVERINAVVDYIERHLGEDLTIERLAAVAHFSPYHFHRVFSALVGETVKQFVNRVRLERAATLLIQQPTSSVTDICTACGYGSPSSFARAFRDAFGMSASEWRNGGYLNYEAGEGLTVRDAIGNIGRLGETYGVAEALYSPASGSTVWRVRAGSLGVVNVTVEDMPDLEVAYVRYTGRYQGMGEVFADLFARLMRWAQPRELVGPETWVLAVYHDNPSITEDDKLRVSACVTVPEDTPPSGDVGRMRLAGGRCAVGRFELGEKDYPEAWYALAAGWLPDSGYEPDDRHPLERFPIGATTASPDKEAVEIWLPVRPLRAY